MAALGYGLSGPLVASSGVPPEQLQGPSFALYAAAVLLLIAVVAPLRLPAGIWTGAVTLGLQDVAASLIAFAALRALPDVVPAVAALPVVGPFVSLLTPYLLPLRSISVVVLVAGVAYAAYRSSAPVWRPIPILHVVVALVAAILVQFVFEPSGALAVRTGLDLSFFAPAGFSLAAAYAGAGVVWVTWLTRYGRAVAAGLLWTGVVIAAFMALDSLNYLSAELLVSDRHSRLGEIVLPYLAVAAGVDRWAAAGLGLLGLERSTAGFTARWHRRRLRPLIRAVRTIAIGAVLWGAALQFEPVGPLAQVAGIVALGACTGVALGELTAYATGRRLPAALTATTAWLGRSPFRNANLGGLVALYATVLRPALYESISYAPLLEWLVLALPVAYLISLVAGGIGQRTEPVSPPAWRGWRRHRQSFTPNPDRPLAHAAALREGYVVTGEVSAISIRIVAAMYHGGAQPAEITSVVRPLCELHVRGVKDPTDASLRNLNARGRAARKDRSARAAVAEAMESVLFEARRATPGQPPQADFAGPLWAEARDAFIATGDVVPLAVVVTVLGAHAGARRDLLAANFSKAIQYRDPKPRWYDLPSARQRLADSARTLRSGFVDEIRPLIPATGGNSR